MGQINFFMTEAEIVNQINELLLSNNFTLFNKTFFDSQIPESISQIDNLDNIDRITIWINNNKYQPKCSSCGAGNFVNNFLFDTYKDPIIELDLGKQTKNILSPCRLFYKTGWIIDEYVRGIHIKATTKLVRTFKKGLTTIIRLKPFYISESIINLLDKDYELELGEGGMRVTKLTINGT